VPRSNLFLSEASTTFFVLFYYSHYNIIIIIIVVIIITIKYLRMKLPGPNCRHCGVPPSYPPLVSLGVVSSVRRFLRHCVLSTFLIIFDYFIIIFFLFDTIFHCFTIIGLRVPLPPSGLRISDRFTGRLPPADVIRMHVYYNCYSYNNLMLTKKKCISRIIVFTMGAKGIINKLLNNILSG